MKVAKTDADIKGLRQYLIFIFMHVNLKGIVSEFEMLSNSIRLLNAGKWTCVSRADAEWEQTAVL